MSLFKGFENVVRQDEPLAMHTWFQLGGPAEYFAESVARFWMGQGGGLSTTVQSYMRKLPDRVTRGFQ